MASGFSATEFRLSLNKQAKAVFDEIPPRDRVRLAKMIKREQPLFRQLAPPGQKAGAGVSSEPWRLPAC